MLDLPTLLPITRQLLGRSLAGEADAKSLKKLAHSLSCLKAFAGGGDGILSAGFLVAAADPDMLAILQACSGLEFLVTETLQTGVSAAIIVGTLKQWKSIASTHRGTEIALKQIRKLLESEGVK